ncbi:hypothetical protein F0562_013653 [Nyssa sinensis]|uniref:Retrotransposon gag domain-containing protein n=1 Tax=Nyssa sinensis TaxID=561372 RepID=A0A5J4ZQH3_9ASTE|nr:hypothetical protein F0562_013653 [Nyssa sinensis]
MDQRVENLEQAMESLSTGQQEILNCMADMFKNYPLAWIILRTTQLENMENPHEHQVKQLVGRQHSNTGNGIGSSSSYVLRLVKLDFPRFNGGEDPTSWLCRAEQFFQFQATPEADRVSLASFHLEGECPVMENPEVSLHAINGDRSVETMRVQGSLRQVAVYALIDFGSTHNFVSEKLAKKVCLKPQLGGNLRVTVASSEQLESPEAQWLCTLGPKLWDFSKLQMKFNANNKEVTLQGLSIPDNKVVNMNQIEAVARKGRDRVLL